MTSYGTIPYEQRVPQSHDGRYISKAKELIERELGSRRPWQEMVQVLDINLPTTIGQLVQRTKINLIYFRVNYGIITFFVLVLSLLWNPISLVVFVPLIFAWLVLYCLRDEPLMICGRAVEYRMLTTGLIIITTGALILAHVVENIAIALLGSVVTVFVHGGLRETEDLFVVVEEEGFECGGEGVVKLPLKHAASASFSIP